MQIKSFSYSLGTGWSCPAFPALDTAQTLVLVFGGSELVQHSEPIRELADAFPRACVVGCSTSGEIHGTKLSDGTLAVAVLRFEQSRLRIASSALSGAGDSYRAACSIARQLAAPDLRGVLVFSDGLVVDGSELVRGFNDNLSPSVVVTGGLAGDGDRFAHTWVVVDRQPRGGYVAAVGLYGEQLQIGHGSRGGWDIFGPERLVTRAAGNILYELDGKPALQLYKEYLGDRAAGLPATALLFPLALRGSTPGEKRVVRTILGVDEATQSMRFAGQIPVGACVQLMRANFDRLIDAASDAALMAVPRAEASGPLFSLAISCVGRRLILGERTEEELEATLDMLAPGTVQIGFYSYGELSPYASGSCDLHNQTMTLTTICEA